MGDVSQLDKGEFGDVGEFLLALKWVKSINNVPVVDLQGGADRVAIYFYLELSNFLEYSDNVT